MTPTPAPAGTGERLEEIRRLNDDATPYTQRTATDAVTDLLALVDKQAGELAEASRDYAELSTMHHDALVRRQSLERELAHERGFDQGHDCPCYYCKEPCGSAVGEEVEVAEILRELRNERSTRIAGTLRLTIADTITTLLARAETTRATALPQPLDDWHEDLGPKLWWKFPINEPPYCGTPLDDDWPEYHTHFTSIPMPDLTAPAVEKE